jgi:hypothetical protein
MKSLQELVGVLVSLHAVTEIGKLGELKVLGLHAKDPNDDIHENSLNELIRMCLQMCPSLQVLVLSGHTIYYPVDLMAQFPSGIQKFITTQGGFFTAFPQWTNLPLSKLTTLFLKLWGVAVQPEHLEKLAELPSLRFLMLQIIAKLDEQEKLSSASGFPCLTYLQLVGPFGFLSFNRGLCQNFKSFTLHSMP